MHIALVCFKYSEYIGVKFLSVFRSNGLHAFFRAKDNVICRLYFTHGRDCLLEAKLRIKFLTDKYLRVKMQSLRDLFGWGVLFPTHRRFGFASRLYVVNRPCCRSARECKMNCVKQE